MVKQGYDDDGRPWLDFSEELAYDTAVGTYMEKIEGALVGIAKEGKLKEINRGIRILLMNARGKVYDMIPMAANPIKERLHVSGKNFKSKLVEMASDSKTEEGMVVIHFTGQVLSPCIGLEGRLSGSSLELGEGGTAGRMLSYWSCKDGVGAGYQLTSEEGHVFKYEEGTRLRLYPSTTGPVKNEKL
jgi:hypothetical protein